MRRKSAMHAAAITGWIWLMLAAAGCGRIGETENTEAAGSGSVPWFCMDFGSNTRAAGSWIYGYWGRRLCRVNKVTGEAELLYEAKSPQEGIFCIDGDFIYFLEKRNVSSLDGERVNLRYVKCDGSDSGLLAEGVAVTEYKRYDLNVWENILYLTCSHGKEKDYRFFRLEENGGAEPVTAAETLYGMLPAGYTDAREKNSYEKIPDLAWCMAHLGYVFVTDGEGRLYRLLPGTEETERFPLSVSGFRGLFLTNHGLVYKDTGNDTWYSVSLEESGQVTEIGRMDGYDVSFWDNEGLYLVKQEYDEDSFRLIRLGWDGELETLHRYVSRGEDYVGSAGILFYDGEQLYFSRKEQGDGVLCRIQPEGTSDEAEPLYVYYDNPLKGVRRSETEAEVFTVEDSGARGEFSLTRVILTEETKAARRINAFLEKEYRKQREYIEELKEEMRAEDTEEDMWPDWSGGAGVEYSVFVSVDYIDSDYISISISEDTFFQGAAHGMYGSREYVFSRTTGERQRIGDVVKKTDEEICRIIAPYIEAKAEWGIDREGWESLILEDWRFFLTEEGIGVHFDVYEMGSYAAGPLDVVVPYEAFRD